MGLSVSSAGSNAPITPTVATNTDKLALTGLASDTTVIITSEGNRVEQFVPAAGGVTVVMSSFGPGQDSDGNDLDSYSGLYVQPMPGSAYINRANNAFINGGPGDWRLRMYNAQEVGISSTGEYPWSALWTGLSSPQVIRHDEVNDDNWVVLRNTVNLNIVNYTPGNVIINGIVCGNGGAVTNVGWVDPSSISYDGQSNGNYINRITYGIVAWYGTLLLDNNALIGAFAVPIPLPPRCLDVTLELQPD